MKTTDTKIEAPVPVGTGDLLGVWECFCDPCYYDMWAVRRTHETGWGQCFHMNSAEEAKGLTALLNHAAGIAAAAECIRHWHDTANGGMIVSGEHVRKLWEALSSANDCGEPRPGGSA